MLISDGIHTVEVEHDENTWWVTAIDGHMGLSVARYTSESEKRMVDAELQRLRQEKNISVNGKIYKLMFKFRDSFGEPSWRIRIKHIEQEE